MNESILFSCPKCENQFKDVDVFNKHMEEGHNVFHNSFPDLSLESGSISKIFILDVGNVKSYFQTNLMLKIIWSEFMSMVNFFSCTLVNSAVWSESK